MLRISECRIDQFSSNDSVDAMVRKYNELGFNVGPNLVKFALANESARARFYQECVDTFDRLIDAVNDSIIKENNKRPGGKRVPGLYGADREYILSIIPKRGIIFKEQLVHLVHECIDTIMCRFYEKEYWNNYSKIQRVVKYLTTRIVRRKDFNDILALFNTSKRPVL